MTQQHWTSLADAMALADQRRAGGDLSGAADLCRQVLRAHPAHGPALHLLGITLHQGGNLLGAIEALRRAVVAQGGIAQYHANLGEMCRQAGRFEDAISEARLALALEPRNVHALNNLGIAHYDRGEYELAMDCYQRAIELQPDSPVAYSNLGNASLAIGNASEALTFYRRAIALKPDYVDAHNNHAMALLLSGHFADGWREFEWRHRRSGRQSARPNAPEWQGESFTGRTLLVMAEEGHGDAIQFLRYLPDVAVRGGKLVLSLHRPLIALARRLVPTADVVALEGVLRGFDIFCSLMSLPRLFGTTLANVPNSVPYLSVDPAIANRWRKRLGASRGLKVGLVWSGARKYLHNARRAVTAEQLAPILHLDGVSWFSLQVGEPAAELARLPSGVTDLSRDLTDFSETAGALLALDLVISTDTAVPHLAGALARPAWVMLAFMPDWRWMLDRETSPWYPTMRLFRQPAPGAWRAVVDVVGRELRSVLKGHRERLMPARETASE